MHHMSLQLFFILFHNKEIVNVTLHKSKHNSNKKKYYGSIFQRYNKETYLKEPFLSVCCCCCCCLRVRIRLLVFSDSVSEDPSKWPLVEWWLAGDRLSDLYFGGLPTRVT